MFWFGCRNPMLHAFNLYNNKYEMTLVNRRPDLPAITKNPANGKQFAVCVEGLYAAYIGAIAAYRAELVSDVTLLANFEKMFEYYGYIPMTVSK